MLICVSAVLCAPAKNVYIQYPATPDPATLTIGSSLTAACNYGVYFNASKPATATQTCQADGTWLPPLSCRCKLFVTLLLWDIIM